MRRSPLPLAFALLWAASPPAALAQAADTLVFETVGDQPISANDLAFDQAGALWATARRLFRLAPEGGAWEEVYYFPHRYVLPLGPDTLLVGGIHRSTDGGDSFFEVYEAGERLFEAPATGTLLVGTDDVTGVAYSADRGATWAAGEIVGGPGTWEPHAEGFAEVPAGHPAAGRLVAAHWPGGLSYSDDRGATWHKSSLWDDHARYDALDVAAGVDGRVYAALFEEGVFGLRVAVSEDGGATYETAYQFTTSGGGYRARLLALPGGLEPALGVLLLVRPDGSVRRSDDGALSWRLLGQVPFGDETDFMEDAVVGPDGRLYVAGVRIGTEREWVYRTTGPVVAAAVETEAELEDDPQGIGLERFAFTVTLSNQTAEPQALQAWTAVTGPVDRSPVLGPVAVTLAPGATLTRRLVQGVPAVAPAGAYTYTVAVGTFPDRVVSADSFTVVKGAAGGGGTSGAGAEGWVVSGWDAASDAAPHGSAPLALAVVPNPTRGAAEVTLTLAGPAEATVAVYDVLGRRVLVLHAGALAAGMHAFALDGSALPPGLYVVRAEVVDPARGTGGRVATRTVTRLR